MKLCVLLSRMGKVIDLTADKYILVAYDGSDCNEDCVGVSPRISSVPDPYSVRDAGGKVPEACEKTASNTAESLDAHYHQGSQSPRDDDEGNDNPPTLCDSESVEDCFPFSPSYSTKDSESEEVCDCCHDTCWCAPTRKSNTINMSAAYTGSSTRCVAASPCEEEDIPEGGTSYYRSNIRSSSTVAMSDSAGASSGDATGKAAVVEVQGLPI